MLYILGFSLLALGGLIVGTHSRGYWALLGLVLAVSGMAINMADTSHCAKPEDVRDYQARRK